jgi:hypothetical protein
VPVVAPVPDVDPELLAVLWSVEPDPAVEPEESDVPVVASAEPVEPVTSAEDPDEPEPVVPVPVLPLFEATEPDEPAAPLVPVVPVVPVVAEPDPEACWFDIVDELAAE